MERFLILALIGLAAIFVVPLLIYQVRLAWKAFRTEQAEQIAQLERHLSEQAESRQRREAEEAERRKHHRATILAALRIEVETIRRGAEQELNDFDLLVRDTPRTQTASHESEVGFRRSFVWTSLPMTTIEQAIHEAYLLGLTNEQLESLQDLRLRLLRTNSQIAAKIAVMSSLVDGGVKQMQSESTQRWVDIRADDLNSTLRNERGQLKSACGKIIQWLPREAG